MAEKIVILGGGESGTGAAILAKKQGFEVFLSDSGMMSEKYRTLLNEYGIEFEEGFHTEEHILEADEVIKSPGIPQTADLIVKLRQKGIPVIGELEFARRYTKAHITAITGSNGKTTTSLLTYHILKNGGLNVGLAGNIGRSFAMQVATENFDHYVLEVSSFQLDDMYEFRADTAVLLNITPDHLDRYDYQMQNYADSKFRIIRNQLPTDAFIYCNDDEETMNALPAKNIQARIYPFSIKNKLTRGAWIEDEKLIINLFKENFNMSISELALQGKHNLYNSMASGIASRVLDMRNEIIRQSMSDFKNIEHRLEYVSTVQGIDFINDSKATNINSVWYALESMNAPVIWIVGGVDKGNDYAMLSALVSQKVKGIICLGKDNKRIHEAFEGSVELIVNAFSAVEAVTLAYHMGKKGDTVLLSPACASFDLFKNYEDRGNQFKAAVKEL